MFRPAATLRTIIPRLHLSLANFSSTPVATADQPNESLELDPSFRALLRDVDISLLKHKQAPHSKVANTRPPMRELETYPTESEEVAVDVREDLHEGEGGREEVDYHAGPRDARKSPAALFGSQSIGQVVLPLELQKSIGLLISESDKTTLHSDARRLFAQDPPASNTTAPKSDNPKPEEETWETSYQLKKYKSIKQASRHAVRDGTAFASIALPAHYAAIYSVLDHVKQRLERGWNVEKVIDWGAGTGSGLWATVHAFQKTPDPENGISADDPQLRHSNIITYTGIDKREGLVTIAKRLLRNVDCGPLSVSWQKTWHEGDKMNRTQGGDTIALSAFMLSALPTGQARKSLVKEMWESGAGVMVLIDHNTTLGFECIAEAREYLLNVGRKEFADPAAEEWDIRGSHVVAPCPHDGTCPLHHPGTKSRLVCSFSQRLQRPSFVRLTKHSGVGHEDTRYSYVVIRRGERPKPPLSLVGRIGAVGKNELEKEAKGKVPVRELMLQGEHEHQLEHQHEELITAAAADFDGIDAAAEQQSASSDLDSTTVVESPSQAQVQQKQSAEEMQEALRLEAFGWPRLVFPPMKRSGHVILDSCTAEGKVMRITIPKSQGKQPFYDARKASWGDMFPHEPKNAPQERYQPTRTTTKKENGGAADPVRGAHIGKRGKKEKVARINSYASLADDLREKKKQVRRERLRAMED